MFVFHGVGEILRFQAKTASFSVNCSILAGNTLYKVTGIKLYPWLCCKHFHSSSRYRIKHFCRFFRRFSGDIQNKVVIVPFSTDYLLIIAVDTLSYWRNGVFSTFLISPVGIPSLLIKVNRSAFIFNW